MLTRFEVEGQYDYKQIRNNQKRQQLALHCHLRSTILPVTLAFNQKSVTATHLALAYEILADSANPRLTHCDLTTFNIGTVRLCQSSLLPEAVVSLCPFIRLSVTLVSHTYLNGSRYRNIFHTSDFRSFWRPNFVVVSFFRVSFRTSASNRGTASAVITLFKIIPDQNQ